MTDGIDPKVDDLQAAQGDAVFKKSTAEAGIE